MDPRKIVNNKGQVKKHIGDLIIEGDIEENSELEIQDGSLEILGTIKDGAKIKIGVSEALRKSMEEKQNRGTSISSVGSISMGNTMMGDVNINNRIFTSDPITDLGNGRYEIVALSDSPFRGFGNFSRFGSVTINGIEQRPRVTAVPGFATALIDGIKYQGKKISIDGDNVLVDGKKITPPVSESSQKPKGPFKLVVHGDIGNNVSIDSDIEVETKGKIGNFCQIKSNYSKITTKNIGEETKLEANGSIKCADIDKGCELKSQYGDLDAKSLKNSVNVTVNKSIKIQEDIGNECYLSTEYGELTARNVGDHVTINSYKDVHVQNVGSHVNIRSQYQELTANQVGDNASIHVYKDATLHSIGTRSQIKSDYQGVTVRNTVSDNVTINAYNDITLSVVGNNTSLTSQYQGITIQQAGDGTQINAYKDVSIHNRIGDNSSITSQYQGVHLHDVGLRVKVQAYKDITATGICPDTRGFRSSYGRLYIAPQPAYQAPVKPSQVTPVASTRGITSALSSMPIEEKKTENKLNTFNKTTQDYMDGLKSKTSHAKVIKDFALSTDAFEEYCDLISTEIMNIPVRVNGHVYDIETLTKLPEKEDGTREDPVSRAEFYLCYIQPAFDIEEKIKDKLRQEIRAKKSPPGGPKLEESPQNAPPGGPGF